MSTNTISKNKCLVLASMSPRRKAILKQIGIPFESAGSMIQETISEGLRPQNLVCQMALHKARAVQNSYKNRWILGADTIVVIKNRIFGKPKNPSECYEMLMSLSGKNHRVITGFCILDPKGKMVHLEAATTKVRIKKLSKIEIQAYIKTGEPFGKAGSYAIQGIGSFMIECVNGSYTNVVGLPVCEVVSALVKCGALTNFPLTE